MASKGEKILVMRRNRKILPIVKKKNVIGTSDQLHGGSDKRFENKNLTAVIINIFKELSILSKLKEHVVKLIYDKNVMEIG